jgi:hypothetical protein
VTKRITYNKRTKTFTLHGAKGDVFNAQDVIDFAKKKGLTNGEYEAHE